MHSEAKTNELLKELIEVQREILEEQRIVSKKIDESVIKICGLLIALLVMVLLSS